MEKDLKKASDDAEEEKEKQKQIVLLLLADRKQAIMKYVEERKRSEDLAQVWNWLILNNFFVTLVFCQILSEEKGRVDSMAEGLEEESKKALQMEAELEKHLAEFDTERQQLKAALAKEEKRFVHFYLLELLLLINWLCFRAREIELELEALKQKMTDTGVPGQSATMRPRPTTAPQLNPKPVNLVPGQWNHPTLPIFKL
jgi:hypothetical protein